MMDLGGSVYRIKNDTLRRAAICIVVPVVYALVSPLFVYQICYRVFPALCDAFTEIRDDYVRPVWVDILVAWQKNLHGQKTPPTGDGGR